MATITIYVSRAGNSNKIKLRDSEGHNPGNDDITTDVSAGDTVVWQLDSNSNLYSLDSIEMKSDSENNLLTAPPVGSNGVFTATVVNPSPGVNKIEKYKIGYTVTQNGGTLYDDPKLKMDN